MSSSYSSFQTKPKHNDAVCLAAAPPRTLLNRFSQLTTVFVFCREISSKMSDSSSSSDSGDEKRERGGSRAREGEGERKGVARELLSDIRWSQATLDLRSFQGGR